MLASRPAFFMEEYDEPQQNPAVELDALLIPWHAVLEVVVGNDFATAIEETEKIGISITAT